MVTANGLVTDNGQVIEIDAPHKLVLKWKNEFKPELQSEGFSFMTYQLVKQGDVVMLTVSHEMDKPQSKFIAGVSQGWPTILSSLKSLLETGKALEFTSRWSEM